MGCKLWVKKKQRKTVNACIREEACQQGRYRKKTKRIKDQYLIAS